MPTFDKMVHFKNYDKQLPIPFVIYAEFEAFTKKVHGCGANDDNSYTKDS